MAGPISQQLEDLLNPLPKFTDPEDDQDEETKAKVEEKFDEGDDGVEDGVAMSGLRKRAITLLSDTDRRYLGKATSRKELQKEIAGSGEDDDDEEEEDEEEEEHDDESDDLEDGEAEDGDEVEDDDDDDDEEMENGIAQIKTLVSKLKETDITFPAETDFHKLTAGMDDLGESEEDDESGEDDGESEEDEDGSEEEDEEDKMEDEDVGAVMTFSKEKVDEQVEKGKAVKDQLVLWDQLLEGRIKMQKALVTANQLPQPQTFSEFKKRGGAEYAGALKNSHKALKALQRSLLELQDQLLYQNPDTRPVSLGKTWGVHSEDEEIPSDEEEDMQQAAESGGEAGPPKRKLEMAEYPGFMAKRFAAFQPYRDATLQKWHDKTRLTMGKSSKGFGAFDRNILTQVEQVMMDKDRLLRRTQTRRSEYRVLGKPEAAAPEATTTTTTTEGEVTEPLLKANTHLKDLDEEIFDDDDFYHQLLRELIERRTSASDPNDQVAMGRQWLAIQKLRSKIKKRVDTKASKGRKTRFHVHSKLMNFMAPIDHSSMNDGARTELYRSLFGKNSYTEVAVAE